MSVAGAFYVYVCLLCFLISGNNTIIYESMTLDDPCEFVCESFDQICCMKNKDALFLDKLR